MPDAATPAGPPGDVPDGASSDEVALRDHATALLEACERALPGWVERAVGHTADAWRPGLGATLQPAAAEAGQRAVDDVVPKLRESLLADPEARVASPLSVLRSGVVHPTAVLRGAGVPEVVRDEFAVRAFPADVYGLSPAAFGDVDPALHELGLVWGAAKAHVVLSRRRR